MLLVVMCFSSWPTSRAAKAQAGKEGGGIETRGFFRYYFRAYVKCTGNEMHHMSMLAPRVGQPAQHAGRSSPAVGIASTMNLSLTDCLPISSKN